MAEKEYIEREEIIKRINIRITSYGRDCNSNAPLMVSAYKEFLYMIENMPTSELQKVVRCKDCSFYEETNYFPDGKKRVCKLFNRQMQEDDFCSYGAKMDKE